MIEFPITLTSGGSVCMPGYVFALALGYTKNLGVYRLHVDATGEWAGLAIRAFWHIPGGADPPASLVVDGYVDVPASVTAQPGSGCVTFEGSDGTKTVTSADLRYRVSANSGTEDGTEPEPGTPAWQQLVDAVHTDATAAEQAKTDAQTAAQQAGASAQKAGNALSDTITAKEDALKATKDAQTAASEASASAENAALAQVTASQLAGQAADSASEAQNSATKAAASQQTAESNAAAAQGSATKAEASASTAVQGQQRAEAAAARAETAQQQTESASTDALDKISSAKTDALKAIGDKQTAATQAVDTARDKALQQVGASTEAAQTAANKAATSAGNADQSAQKAAGSLQELKNGIASGEFKGEPGNDGKSPVVTVTDIENGHRVSITDKDGTKTIDVLNGKDGKDAPQIDDTTVTDSAPWSSKHIVDVLCPPISETGNPAQFYPVAGYPLGCKVSWEPTQEGSGTPSPENIRPIKGRDSVTVTRCGENLFNPAWMPEKTLNNGLTWTITSDGTVTANGTANGTSYYNSDYFSLPAGTYTISAMPYFRMSILNRDVGDTTVAAQQVGQPCTFTVETDIQNASLFFGTSGILDNVSAKPQIEKGTTATTYAPYTGQTATLTLPRTIYGGTVDTVSSEGQETRKLLTLDGTEKWMVSGKFLDNKTDWYYVSSKIPNAVNAAPQKGNEICSHYPHADIANTNTAQGCAIVWGAIRVRWGDTIPDDADAWKAHLAAQYAAGTPVQIAYKLAEPVPFTVTGAQPISALSGVNTLLTDADSVTVTGRADPIKRITDLEDAVASMT